ncbi:MAG: hypothetical protein QOH26_1862 [Actinomycetota bacterium]|jgi:hypothetical protein|nr:hypothetical protein [Actinomycetota bacterium]
MAIAVIVSGTIFAVGPWAAAALDQDKPVRATNAGELAAAAAPGYFVWMQNSLDRQKHFDVFLKTSNGRLRVNAPGTEGAMGGISGNRLVYQQYTGGDPVRGSSDVYEFNLKTHERRALGGVNTGEWEYTPTISDEWLLFARWSSKTDTRKVILRNVKSGAQRTLASVSSRAYVQAGQVNGNWVSYLRHQKGAPRYKAALYRYNISTKERSSVVDRYAWGPSVSDQGDVFYLSTGSECGSRPRFKRFRPTVKAGDEETAVLLRLREGIDMARSYAYRDVQGRLAVLHEKAHCKNLDTGSDIYRLQ